MTYPDDEGKSIGINSFFEPFYHRYGHNTSSDLFQKNRYYEPIDEIGSTYLCGKVENKKNCYIQATEFSPENTLETNNEKNQKKHKGRKQLKQLPKRSPSKRRKGVYSEKEL